jgi:hypothetical protein
MMKNCCKKLGILLFSLFYHKADSDKSSGSFLGQEGPWKKTQERRFLKAQLSLLFSKNPAITLSFVLKKNLLGESSELKILDVSSLLLNGSSPVE